MEKSFKNLPFDVQFEILKNKPYFRRLNKIYYETGKSFYQDYYCHLEIKPKEAFDYILHHQPKTFAIYGYEEGSPVLYTFTKSDDIYNININYLYMIEIDMDEYTIDLATDDVLINIVELSDFLEEINDKSYKFHYDLNLISHIMDNRGCFHFDMLTELYKNIVRGDIEDLNLLMYLASNLDIIKGSGHFFIEDVLLFIDHITEDLLFNSNGENITEDETIQEVLDSKINDYLNFYEKI